MKQLATVCDSILMKGGIVGWPGIARGYLYFYGFILCLTASALLLEFVFEPFGWLKNLAIYGTIVAGLTVHAVMVWRVFQRTPYKTFGAQNVLDILFITQLPIVGPYLWIKKYADAFLSKPQHPIQAKRPCSLLEWVGVVLIVAIPLIIYFFS